MRSSARAATDMAATDTRLGQRIADVTERKRGILRPDMGDRRELAGFH